MKYDVVIVGAGPAGLSAAIYCARYKLKTLVVGKLAGGLASEAHEVWNFPSHEKIKGFELMMKMINQVKKLDVEIKQEEVLELKKGFEVVTDKSKYSAKAIILATGSERKRLGIERERELMGKGINYCATCDSNFYKDKTVGVVGGRNSALSSALLLSRFAKKVYLIYRQDKFSKAEPTLNQDIKKNKKIIPVFNSVVTKLIGKTKLEGVEVSQKGKSKKIKLDGLFVEIGGVSNLELAKGLGVKTDKKYILVDKYQKTNVKGVFAAGDITDNPLKQIITACGEGAIAAYGVYDELRS